jgi:hypothetical protein
VRNDKRTLILKKEKLSFLATNSSDLELILRLYFKTSKIRTEALSKLTIK